MAKIIKMMDILKKEGIELGKVYTDKDMPPFKVEGKLTEKKPWQGYKAHAVHGKAEVDFLNLISDFPDWKKYNKLTDKGKNVIFFTKKDKNALVWQTSNGREVQATNLKGDESSYKSYKVKDIYKVLVEGKLVEMKVNKGKVDKTYKSVLNHMRKVIKKLNDDEMYEVTTQLKKWFNKNIY